MISDNYIEIAQNEFGALFDYAINDCKINIKDFEKMFIKSEVVKRLEENDMLLISGHSGVELANMFIPKNKHTNPSYPIMYRTKEFWVGFALVYLWLNSIYTFEQILSKVSLLEIRSMYMPYHEMDITHFYNDMLTLIQTNKLQEYRKKANLSQSELSAIANVSLKTIQKYERKERLLLNASVDNLFKLSKALNCTIENLLF